MTAARGSLVLLLQLDYVIFLADNRNFESLLFSYTRAPPSCRRPGLWPHKIVDAVLAQLLVTLHIATPCDGVVRHFRFFPQPSHGHTYLAPLVLAFYLHCDTLQRLPRRLLHPVVLLLRLLRPRFESNTSMLTRKSPVLMRTPHGHSNPKDDLLLRHFALLHPWQQRLLHHPLLFFLLFIP